MGKRSVYAALLLVVLSACQETKITDPTLITGSGPVSVLQSSYVSSGDSRPALGAGPVTYIISTIEFTNDQTAAVYPVISHFSITDRAGSRYFGIDRGSSALAGIANDTGPIAPGAKRTFMIGFRADATTIGTIRYDY